jgi:hypothetical protein
MRNNFFLPIVLFAINGVLFYYFGSIPGYMNYIFYAGEGLGFILDYSPIIIISPVLIIWQLYNIYKWIVKKYWNN